MQTQSDESPSVGIIAETKEKSLTVPFFFFFLLYEPVGQVNVLGLVRESLVVKNVAVNKLDLCWTETQHVALDLVPLLKNPTNVANVVRLKW